MTINYVKFSLKINLANFEYRSWDYEVPDRSRLIFKLNYRFYGKKFEILGSTDRLYK